MKHFKKIIVYSLLVFLFIILSACTKQTVADGSSKVQKQPSAEETAQMAKEAAEAEANRQAEYEAWAKAGAGKGTTEQPPQQNFFYEIIKVENQSNKAMGSRLLSSFTTQEIANLPTNKKMVYRIVVPPTIKESQVRPTVEKIISDITTKDNDIDEIGLFLYSDRKLINGAYDVARATWAPGGKLGNVTPEIAINNDRSSYQINVQIFVSMFK